MRYTMAVRDKNLFKDFLCEEREYLHMVSFEDKDKDTICDLLLKQFTINNPGYAGDKGILKWFYETAVDEDYVVYIIDFGNRQFTEYGVIDRDDFRKAVLKQEAELKRFADKAEYIKNTFDKNTIERKSSIATGFSKFTFFDVDNGIEIPFRLKEVKGEEKRPLLIFFHGAGCVGEDNFKQIAEFRSMGIKLTEECFVLVPQSNHFTGNNLSTINLYTKSVGTLVKMLVESYPVDPERIYVTGISYGGACTWYSVYNNPGLYAAAIPLMGYFPDVDSDKFDADAFKGEKIWAGHAADDEDVSSDSDEKMYEKLRGKCDIRLSLYPSGGHTVMRRFYGREKWQEWMFAQKRTDKD